MTLRKATNITWHEGDVTREERQRISGRRADRLDDGAFGRGKSTIAVALERMLLARGQPRLRLDGDNIRFGLNKNLGFSPRTAPRTSAGSAKWRSSSPTPASSRSRLHQSLPRDRDKVRKLHDDAKLLFLEVYVDCALEEAERRDPKGSTRRRARARSRGSPVSTIPTSLRSARSVVLRTDRLSVADSVAELLAAFERLELLES